MRKKINISIPQPCHENWEGMSPVEKGKFCSSCQKKVFDFTKASDKEIIDILQNEDATCGRFTLSQLNRNLYTNQQKSSYWLIASATILGFLGLGNQSSYAQVKNETVQVDSKGLIIENDSIKINETYLLKGIVSDKDGPIPGVSIVLKGAYKGSMTDYDGKYEIPVERNDIIEFSHISYEKLQYKIYTKTPLNVFLVQNEELLSSGIIQVGGICKRKNFFGRIFHKIGNLFK